MVLLTGCATSEQPLVFAGGPLQADTSAVDSYQLAIDLIEQELGLEVEFFEATDRAAIAEGLASGQIDMASIDPYGYVLSRGISTDVEVVLSMARDPEQKPGFKSFALAGAQDNTVQSLADAKGKTVCYSDPASTAGFLFPALGFSQAGLNPNPDTTDDFTAIFTGIVASQPAISVSAGDCAIGFVPDGFYSNVLPNIEGFDIDSVKVIWESELIPAYAIAVNKTSVDSETIEDVVELLASQGNKSYFADIGICETEADCNYLNDQSWGYVTSTDMDYESVRVACLALGIMNCG